MKITKIFEIDDIKTMEEMRDVYLVCFDGNSRKSFIFKAAKGNGVVFVFQQQQWINIEDTKLEPVGWFPEEGFLGEIVEDERQKNNSQEQKT